MNTKEKSKRGKAIIGIALATIMLASLAAMVPTVSAAYGTTHNDIITGETNSVLIGQKLNFSVPGISIIGKSPEEIEGQTFGITSDDYNTKSYFVVTGLYCVDDGDTSGECDVNDTLLSVNEPLMEITLKATAAGKTQSVDTITEGTDLLIDFIYNLNTSDVVDLKIINPDGDTLKFNPELPSQEFNDIKVGYIDANYSVGAVGINTSKWDLGTYKIYIKTEPEKAEGLDESSNEKTIKILKSKIAVEASTTSASELERIKLTVTGVANSSIWIGTSDPEHTLFPAGVSDNQPVTVDANGDTVNESMSHQLGAAGTRTYAVEFNDTGTYTITVTDKTATPSVEDSVDIYISERAVTFDLPITVVIGDKLTVKGTANTGKKVDIYIDGELYLGLDDLVIENGEFSEEVTADADIGMGIPGTVRLKAWIDSDIPGKTDGEDDTPPRAMDGDTALLLVEPGLTGEISVETVAQEDSFYVKGTANGARSVDVLTVAPKGASGKGIRPDDVPGFNGLTMDSPSVLDIEDSFSQKMTVDETAGTGRYLVAVLYKGRDGYYGTTGDETKTLIQTLNTYGDLKGKTQEQILAMLVHITTKAGSDDLIWVGTIKVEAAKVTLDTIADVAIGEPLAVAGTTNREEGHTILITAKGPVELTPEIALVENGTFSTTFDTTDAEVGTYTVTADDGDGHTDDATVEIVKEIVPVATPTPAPTAKPTATPAPTPVATAEPTPTPTEEPGFEAVFAIAGLLSIAYLVLRRRK